MWIHEEYQRLAREHGAVAALETALQAANYDRIDGGDVNLPGTEFWSKRMWRLYAK